MGNPEDTAGSRRRTMSPVLAMDDFKPLSATVRVEFGARSRPGPQRSTNEDHFLIARLSRLQEIVASSLSQGDLPGRFEEYGYAMLVADGGGAEGSGGFASRVAISTFAHLALYLGKWNLRIDDRIAEEVIERTHAFYDHVTHAIDWRARSEPILAGMGTTLTATFSAGDDLFHAHVGDSRAYLFRAGELTQLTRDHTLEQRLADEGAPVAVQRAAQDLGHILTDALGGAGGPPVVDVERIGLIDSDVILLCTNGLTTVVDDAAIADVLAQPRRLDDQCETLVELARQRGSEDDVTVVVAHYRIPSAPTYG